MAIAQSTLSESTPVNLFDGRVTFPAQGERGPHCGDVTPVGFCTADPDHLRFGETGCGRRTCPRCGEGWLRDRTAESAIRIMARRWANEDSREGRRVVSAVFSPEPGSVETVRELWEMRSRAQDLADDHGIRGGMSVVHAFRAYDRTKDRFQALKRKGVIEGYVSLWEWIFDNDKPWELQCYFSPHVHIIGLCDDFEVEEGSDAGGCQMHTPWVCKNLSKGKGTFDRFSELRDGADPENDAYGDVVEAVEYALHHSAIVDGRNAVTWFGSMSHVKFSSEDAISPGSLSVIRRKVGEEVGLEEADEDGHEFHECQVEGCYGRVESLTAAYGYVDRHDLSEDKERRLMAASAWFEGLRKPPPGMKHPKTRERAEEAIEAMAGSGGKGPLA